MIQTLLKALPLIGPPLTAKLAGVNGFTGRGAVRYVANRNGVRKLCVQLRGVAGRKADIVANHAQAAVMKINNGQGDAVFASGKGDDLPELCEGARIDIQQNGEIVLSGVLARK